MTHKSIDVSCMSDKTVKDTIYSTNGNSLIIRFTDGTYCVLEADDSFDGIEIFSTNEVNYELFSKQVLNECEFLLDAELDTIYDDLAHQQKLDTICMIKEQMVDNKITVDDLM